MDRSVAPIGLAIALRGSGLRLAGPLGTGSGGPRWSATDDQRARWVLTVVPQRRAEGARRRAVALAGLDHPHLTRPGPVVDLPDGSVVIAHEAVPGFDLAALAAARGALRPGEVVGLLVPVAHALAALHGAGLSHGDVSPANVVVAADGRAVLVDLVLGSDADEHGTAGFAAPERRDGAGSAGDVHALARVGLALLGASNPTTGPAAVRAQVAGPAPVRTISPQAAVVEDRLRAVLVRAADDDPRRRGSARQLADAMGAVCSAEPAELPDPAVLAGLALRRLARPGGAGSRTGREGGPAPLGATTRRRAARGRHRRRRVGRVQGWAFGAVAAVAGAALAGAASAGVLEPAPGASGAGGPLAAATRLTAARTAALGTLDAHALGAVTLPGSPAADADRDLLAVLVRTGRMPRVAQLSVLVRPGVGPHRVVTGSWLLTAEGASYSQVELELARTPVGWRVAEVRPSAP